MCDFLQSLVDVRSMFIYSIYSLLHDKRNGCVQRRDDNAMDRARPTYRLLVQSRLQTVFLSFFSFFFLGGGEVDLLPSDTRLTAPEVLRNPDYLPPSGIHPAFRETFKEVTRHSSLQMVMANLPGSGTWSTCGVISTWASTRARRQNGKQLKAGESEQAAAKAKAKATAKPTVKSIGAVAPCTIPVPSTRVGMVRLVVLSREDKEGGVLQFSAGRFATFVAVPTQSIFCQILPNDSEWDKYGNFVAKAVGNFATLINKCFHAPTPTLPSDQYTFMEAVCIVEFGCL